MTFLVKLIYGKEREKLSALSTPVLLESTALSLESPINQNQFVVTGLTAVALVVSIVAFSISEIQFIIDTCTESFCSANLFT